jgi:hypothetical protein
MSERTGREVVKRAALVAAAATAAVGFGSANAQAVAPSNGSPGAAVESRTLDVTDLSTVADDGTALARVVNRVITQSDTFGTQGMHDSGVPGV